MSSNWDPIKECLITDSHVVLTSGKHSRLYFNKKVLFNNQEELSRHCEMIAHHFREAGIETVIGPAEGGTVVATWTAYHLSKICGKSIKPCRAEKSGDGDFVIAPEFGALIARKPVLVVDDVISTGNSPAKVVWQCIALGARVKGVGAVCNRGGEAIKRVIPSSDIFAAITVSASKVTFNEESCPMCAIGLPINMAVGHGAEFLLRKADVYRVCGIGGCSGLATWTDKSQGKFECAYCGRESRETEGG